MLDKIAMIVMLILYVVFGLVALFMYLIIKASDENKAEWERKIEDEEQMNYLKEYRNRRKKVGGTSK